MSNLYLLHPEQPHQDLRRELADCIADYDKASANARVAKASHDRAAHFLADARAATMRAKSALTTARNTATESAARSIAEAIRDGRCAIPTALPTHASDAAYSAALSQQQALEMAVSELAAELATADDLASQAASTVRSLIEQILEGEARVLADEVVRTQQAHWAALDRLAGLVLIDESRQQGGPRLRELQREVLVKIDRRRAAVAQNGLLREDHNYNQHLDLLAEVQRRKWAGYENRLSTDATAVFDTREPAQ